MTSKRREHIVKSHEPTLKAIAKAAGKNPECLRSTAANLAKDLGIKIKKTRIRR